MKASAISSQFLFIESSSLAYQMAAILDRVRLKSDNFYSLVRPIGRRILENNRRWTIKSPEPSNRSICGILNLSSNVTAESVKPSSVSGIEFTPYARLKSFSSLLTFSTVRSTSNSNSASIG